MKLLVQRVSKASVEVNKELIASIKEGALVFVGFDKDDSTHKVESLADKLIRYKIFNDKKGRLSLSLLETKTEILVVPQVTLSVGTNKGTKPSFSDAATPEIGEMLFEEFKMILSKNMERSVRVNLGLICRLVLLMKGQLPFGSIYRSSSFFFTKRSAITIPNSKSNQAGIANRLWEITSGGVMSIPTVKHAITT